MRTVFIDVDTQIDFLFPAGSLYVPAAEQIIPAVARLNSYASANNIPLISTADAHSENDPEFRTWPYHCVRGTIGQQKPAATLVANQTIFNKVTTDIFAAPGFTDLLDALNADRYVVYGVVTEICVGSVVRGLMKRTGSQIEIVTDAVQHFNRDLADHLFAQLESAGGRLTVSQHWIA